MPSVPSQCLLQLDQIDVYFKLLYFELQKNWSVIKI